MKTCRCEIAHAAMPEPNSRPDVRIPSAPRKSKSPAGQMQHTGLALRRSGTGAIQPKIPRHNRMTATTDAMLDVTREAMRDDRREMNLKKKKKKKKKRAIARHNSQTILPKTPICSNANKGFSPKARSSEKFVHHEAVPFCRLPPTRGLALTFAAPAGPAVPFASTPPLPSSPSALTVLARRRFWGTLGLAFPLGT